MGININYSHVDPPTSKLVQGLASAGDDSPFFPSVSHIVDYTHFSTTEFWSQKKDLRVALIRLLVHTDPLCGVKLPQAAFLPLPVFHTVPSS